MPGPKINENSHTQRTHGGGARSPASLNFTAALALHTQQVQFALSMLSCHSTPRILQRVDSAVTIVCYGMAVLFVYIKLFYAY